MIDWFTGPRPLISTPARVLKCRGFGFLTTWQTNIMRLVHGGSILVEFAPADPECIRIQMASNKSHMERVLTMDEACQLARELMGLLNLQERQAAEKTRAAINQDPTTFAMSVQSLPVSAADYESA